MSSSKAPTKGNRSNTKIGASRPPTLVDVRALRKRLDNQGQEAVQHHPHKASGPSNREPSHEPIPNGIHAGDSDDSFTYMGNQGMLRLATIAYRREIDGDDPSSQDNDLMSEAASQESLTEEAEPEGHEIPNTASTPNAPRAPPVPASRAQPASFSLTPFIPPAPVARTPPAPPAIASSSGAPRHAAQLQQDAQLAASANLTNASPAVPVALHLVLTPHDQVDAFLKTSVVDGNCSVRTVDSLRSLIIYSDKPAHYDEVGSVITIDLRRQSRQFSVGPNREQPDALPLTESESPPPPTRLSTNSSAHQPPLLVKVTVLVVLAILAVSLASFAGRLVVTVWSELAFTPYEELSGVVLSLVRCCALAMKAALFKIIEGFGHASQWVFYTLMHISLAIQRTRFSMARTVQWRLRTLVDLMLRALERLRDMIALEATGLTLPSAAANSE